MGNRISAFWKLCVIENPQDNASISLMESLDIIWLHTDISMDRVGTDLYIFKMCSKFFLRMSHVNPRKMSHYLANVPACYLTGCKTRGSTV